jgi:hypothetical protein
MHFDIRISERFGKTRVLLSELQQLTIISMFAMTAILMTILLVFPIMAAIQDMDPLSQWTNLVFKFQLLNYNFWTINLLVGFRALHLYYVGYGIIRAIGLWTQILYVMCTMRNMGLRRISTYSQNAPGISRIYEAAHKMYSRMVVLNMVTMTNFCILFTKLIL